MTTTITPYVLTRVISLYLWRVEKDGVLVASGSANDREVAESEISIYASEA